MTKAKLPTAIAYRPRLKDPYKPSSISLISPLNRTRSLKRILTLQKLIPWIV
jgi:hypothetical protein